MAKSHIIFGVMTHSAIETRQQKEQGVGEGVGGWGVGMWWSWTKFEKGG